jgi:putative FmdB family regulatory protein
MPMYDFICHDCKVFFEKKYPMVKAPGRSKCPECGKLANRDYQDIAVHFIGECHTNKRNIERSKTNQFELKRLGDTLINKTKESLDIAKTQDFYSNMQPSEHFKDHYSDYTFKKLNAKEMDERKRQAASIANTVNKLGSHHIDKSGNHIERGHTRGKKD